MKTDLRLKPTARRARVLRGHPWVFRGELERLPRSLTDGTGVTLCDGQGRLLGSGILNARSKIAWRRFAREERPFDAAFLREALEAAVTRREGQGGIGRLVWSEADHLPGLVIDRFDAVFVVQATTLAMDRNLDTIESWLRERYTVEEIVYRNDAPSRRHEGLGQEVRTASGESFAPRWLEIDGVRHEIDLTGSQKTGFYLDQRDEHRRIGSLSEGRRVLDAFAGQGAFALQAARGGAASVLAVETSEEGVERGRRAAVENGLSIEWRAENVFDFFTHHRDERFGLIVLDPPSFARNRGALDGALRGYKEINLRALGCLEPGGTLATYSCSQHVDRETFLAVLMDAAADARREVEVVTLTGQPADHPVLLNVPETEYLKGAILRVR